MTAMASSSATTAPPAGSPVALESSRLDDLVRRGGIAVLIALAPALVLYLSFNNGGYFPNTVGLACIGAAAALVLRITLADRPFEGYGRGVAVPLIALGLLAGVQLASALWSHDSARALDAYDRTLLYVLAFALFGSLAWTAQRLAWLIRLVALGATVVCLAGLTSRLLPHLWPTASGFFSNRLSYPLGYWNAVGFMAVIATILLFHLSSTAERGAVRVAAAVLIPPVATTLLLTYSRGAIAAGMVGLVVYLAMGGFRFVLGALIAAAPTVAIALHEAYGAVLLSGANPTSPAAVSQGRHVAVTVGICMLVAGVLRAASLTLDARLGHAPGLWTRIIDLPWRAIVAGAALVALVVLIAAGAPAYVSRQYDRFVNTNSGPNATLTRDRLSDPASSGRIALWQVALKEYGGHELAGGGAGTYQTYSAQHRTNANTVTDAHSLYLQTLAETGIAGLLLLAVALLSIVIVLVLRSRGRQRSAYAAMFAVAIAWAVHSAVDWDWQMPAVTLPLFVFAGHALASSRTAAPSTVAGPRNRTALAVGVLVLAVAPLLVGVSYQRLRASGAAFQSGNCPLAKKRALSSISLLAVRADAYEILGYCDLAQDFPAEGLQAMRKAESYERDNWNYAYGTAIALAANDLDPRGEASHALTLNPRVDLATRALKTLGSARSGTWPDASRVVILQGLQSGELSVSNL
jgi:hypothetical protein